MLGEALCGAIPKAAITPNKGRLNKTNSQLNLNRRIWGDAFCAKMGTSSLYMLFPQLFEEILADNAKSAKVEYTESKYRG
jgi:hypothetical protein